MRRLLIACSTMALVAGAAGCAEDPEAVADAGTGEETRQAANYTEDHPWVGLPVRGVNGERLGSVSFVGMEDGEPVAGVDADVETLVIETGGLLGFGDREVELEASQARLEVDADDEFVRLALDEDAVEALPEIETDDFDDDGLFADSDDETIEDPENPSL